MISLLEKYSKVSWLFAVVSAVLIFYISSMTFPPGKAVTDRPSIFYHFIAFFFLAFFLLPALVKGERKNFVFLAAVIAILYGIFDEIHQFFVPGRICSFSDMLINSAGILFASLLYIISVKIRTKAT